MDTTLHDGATSISRRVVDRGVVSDDDAFGLIWKTRQAYSNEVGGVAPWLLTIVPCRVINVARRKGGDRACRCSDELLATLHAPERGLEHVERRCQAAGLRELIVALPDEQREPITLAFYAKLTDAEIAARPAISLGTAKGSVRLGLNRLRGEVHRVVA